MAPDHSVSPLVTNRCCGHKVVPVVATITNPGMWTLAAKDSIKLKKESCRPILDYGTPEAVERYGQIKMGAAMAFSTAKDPGMRRFQ